MPGDCCSQRRALRRIEERVAGLEARMADHEGHMPAATLGVPISLDVKVFIAQLQEKIRELEIEAASGRGAQKTSHWHLVQYAWDRLRTIKQTETGTIRDSGDFEQLIEDVITLVKHLQRG